MVGGLADGDDHLLTAAPSISAGKRFRMPPPKMTALRSVLLGSLGEPDLRNMPVYLWMVNRPLSALTEEVVVPMLGASMAARKKDRSTGLEYVGRM